MMKILRKLFQPAPSTEMIIKKDSETKQIGIKMQVLAWLVFLFIVGAYLEETIELKKNPNEIPTTILSTNGVKEVHLRQNYLGHYTVKGEINGFAVTFLVDTGATGVAIPEIIAKKLSLPLGKRLKTSTAAGETTAYLSRLEVVKVGQIILNDVEAAIVPKMQTDYILLGMSFLKHIEFIQREGILTLRQRG